MAKFSIKNAIVYGFSAYFQHVVLVAAVGLTLGLSTWGLQRVPSMVATKMGIHLDAAKIPSKGVAPVNVAQKVQGQKKLAKVKGIRDSLHEVGEKIGGVVSQKAYFYLNNVDKSDILVLALVWLLMFGIWSFLYLGFVRVMLDIKDKNKSSYQQLFSQRKIFWSYIGLLIVWVLLMTCIVLGSMVGGGLLTVLVGIPLSFLGWSGDIVAVSLGGLTAFVVALYFFTRYAFAFYSLVDKGAGIHKALTSSYELTKGSVLKLILFFFIISIPFGGHYAFNVNVGQEHFSIATHLSNSSALMANLIVGLFLSLYSLCCVFVYKKLGGRN
jgi:hypothetical protein